MSTDTAPEFFPEAGGPESLEEVERRRAESFFQRALCLRTWWRLTPEERDQIRSVVFAENPYYRTHPDGICFEAECIKEVARLLADGRARSVA